MDVTALMLSRIQFASTVSFHIIFPAFTVGLAAWLCVLEGMSLATGLPVYRRLFEFWRAIFGVAFAMGVVSCIVMAFQSGTNWSELSRRTGAIQGPLLGYESFTAFALEASFFGVMMFGRRRLPPVAYFASCLMVALGTTMSSFWIMVNNSWMQWPTGYAMGPGGTFVATDWTAIVFTRIGEMLLHVAFVLAVVLLITLAVVLGSPVTPRRTYLHIGVLGCGELRTLVDDRIAASAAAAASLSPRRTCWP